MENRRIGITQWHSAETESQNDNIYKVKQNYGYLLLVWEGHTAQR